MTLDITLEQAQILGFALTLAKRNQDEQAHGHVRRGNSVAELGCRDRAARIEELRVLLDAADFAPYREYA